MDRREFLTNLISETSLENHYHAFKILIRRLRTYKTIFIYGAGGWGISLQKLLEAYSIHTYAFFDQNADKIKTINGIPVHQLDKYDVGEDEKENTLVIVAVRLELQEIVGDILTKKGFINWTSINGIWHYSSWSSQDELYSIVHQKNDILSGFDLWADDKSMDVYYDHIECYVTRNYNVRSQVDRKQYFPDDIVFSKGYSNFIDCGAFNGDTIDDLSVHVGKVNKVVAFEPDAGNFKILSSKLAVKKDRIAKEIFLYPCGVWSSSTTMAFDSAQGHNCHISLSGKTFLQCAALDEVLFNWAPTFIKMDIEGAEIEGIKGAKEIIKKDRPDLAISVYHAIEHLWIIPLLLRTLNKDYEYYLRSHEHFNQETILYAVTK